jgi:hypothetical protein
MAAVVIFNIFFAALVVVGMLSLLVGAIVRDARTHGTRIAPSLKILGAHPRLRPFQKSGAAGSPA